MNPLSLLIAAFGFVATASATAAGPIPITPKPAVSQQATVGYYSGKSTSAAKLTDFKSIAIPENFPGLKKGDEVFLPAFAGKTLPNGK